MAHSSLVPGLPPSLRTLTIARYASGLSPILAESWYLIAATALVCADQLLQSISGRSFKIGMFECVRLSPKIKTIMR